MESEHYVVDQLEGDIAVLETPERELVEVPRVDLPDDAEEGSMLVRHKDEEGNTGFSVDHEAGTKKLEEMEALRASLPRAPGGDL